MANIGRAYGRIIPTVAALLRDLLSRPTLEKEEKKKNNKEIYGGEREETPADVQDVGRWKCLRVAGLPLVYKRTFTRIDIRVWVIR